MDWWILYWRQTKTLSPWVWSMLFSLDTHSMDVCGWSGHSGLWVWPMESNRCSEGLVHLACWLWWLEGQPRDGMSAELWSEKIHMCFCRQEIGHWIRGVMLTIAQIRYFFHRTPYSESNFTQCALACSGQAGNIYHWFGCKDGQSRFFQYFHTAFQRKNQPNNNKKQTQKPPTFREGLKGWIPAKRGWSPQPVSPYRKAPWGQVS